MMNQQQADRVLAEADLLHDNIEIDTALNSMAASLNLHYAERDPVVFCVMNGALILAGMLLPKFTFSFRFDYLHATRYRDKTRGGELEWIKQSDIDITDRHVLVIDDILDEGFTLSAIVDNMQRQGAAEVKTAVLAHKQHDRSNGFKADFKGMDIEDRYVFGMGMDYQGYLRHLPAIYAVKGL